MKLIFLWIFAIASLTLRVQKHKNDTAMYVFPYWIKEGQEAMSGSFLWQSKAVILIHLNSHHLWMIRNIDVLQPFCQVRAMCIAQLTHDSVIWSIFLCLHSDLRSFCIAAVKYAIQRSIPLFFFRCKLNSMDLFCSHFNPHKLLG